ncbi:MAG TPA: translocation/assembly module TamB domain-containing protein [Stellaceae bacterium]|nr:translocation/assembly module TamB domain-containing protein [Stellaceae bacterium]
MRAVARWLAIALAVPILLALVGFGLLQTRAAQAWLAAVIARSASKPDFVVSIAGLRGFLPFHVNIDRIAIADAGGVYLTLHGVDLDLAPADLIAGALHIRGLEIAEIDMARPSTAASAPLSEYLQVPHIPLTLVLDRLVIARLALAPPVLGESVVATLAGNGEIRGGAARAALDLDRTDGVPGKLALLMSLTGTHPVLSLRLHADEPTGILLDRWLGRTDRPALTLSFDGRGPLADWHGRLTASAGALARLDANVALEVGSATVLGLSGKAAVAPLLPADLASPVGAQAGFSLRVRFGRRIVVKRLSLDLAAGTLSGDAAFGGPNRAIAAHLRANFPRLAVLSGIAGAPLEGAASLNIGVTGSQDHPVVTADLTAAGIAAAGSAAKRVAVHVAARPTGSLADAATRIAVAANGRIEGLAVARAGAMAQRLGRRIDWSLAASADRAARAIELSQLKAQDGGLAVAGSGRLAIAGSATYGEVDFTGSAVGMRTGIAAVDALIGAKAVFAGAVRRTPAGALALDRVALTGAAAKLSGHAQFDPASHILAAAVTLDVPQLKPLGAALGTKLAGTVTAWMTVQGPLDRLRLQTELEGRSIAGGGAAIQRFRLSGEVADLAQPTAAIDGNFRALGLDGRLALTAGLIGNSELAIPHLRVQAADSTIEGNLRVALATGLLQGALAARLPDLSRWSGLAGRPLGGSLELNANFAAQRGGQALGLSLAAARLAAGAGSSRIAIGRLALSARLADIWRMPSATGRLALSAAQIGAADFANAAATFSSPRPGRFPFSGSAEGQPLTVSFAGEGGLAPGGAELRLTHLTGSLGSDRILLAQPLELSRRGADLAFSGLDLRLGAGRVAGSGAVNGATLSLALNATDLPLATGARLVGYPGVHGALSLAARLGGTLDAPRGHVAADARGLSLAVSKHVQAPRLGLSLAGDWNGRTIDLQGRVTGLTGDRISVAGSLPLVLTRAPLGISLPPRDALSLRLQGGGELSHLADLLPLGEDRLSGRFTADVAVGGTIASPAASGRLQLSGVRYENFATGAVLTNLSADLFGDRDRFKLASLSAGDGAAGSLTAQGSLVLDGASGPSAELSARLAKFRLAARDEVLATASGTVSVSGPLAAPRVAAALTLDRADINLPDSLPPSVVVLQVTEIGGSTGKPLATASAAPAFSAALDIAIAMPGQVSVRGHGLNSNWRGRLRITGTSAAPRIAGVLLASRGSVDLLGKSFRLTRGAITFDGSAKLDPALDIVAEANAADITAQVIITGYASAPKIILASTPPVPQDEILSRILFNQGVGQINAGQGVQLAAAAATLAGGGPGVLDRLRGKLGLDWLGLGQGPAGAASPILNPSVVNPSTSSATALSAGKYLMPGVSVGVTQGVSPPTSKVTVEVDVGHHVTVDTEAGQNGGTGIGLNYKYDY